MRLAICLAWRLFSIFYAHTMRSMTRQEGSMSAVYKTDAPKRPVNMTLNEDLVRVARTMTSNLSDHVEKLLGAYVQEEQQRLIEEDARIAKAIVASNEFWDKHEFPGDEFMEDFA
jgi:antitoxin CcdA